MAIRLDNGESGQLTTPLTTQTLSYIGATNEADSAPNYSSNVYVTDGTSLTVATGALDAALNAHATASDPHTAYIKVDGTRAFSGDQSMGGNQLTNVGNPAAGTDALNRDSGDTRYVQRSGGSMLSNLDMNGFKIIDMDDPTSAQDAATKAYVDTSTASFPTHTHTISSSIDNANFSYSVGEIEVTDASGNYFYNYSSEVAWPLSRNGANDGRVYFDTVVSGKRFCVLWAASATPGVSLKDDNTGNANFFGIDSVNFVGGTEWYYQMTGAPDFSAYTTAQNAVFWQSWITVIDLNYLDASAEYPSGMKPIRIATQNVNTTETGDDLFTFHMNFGTGHFFTWALGHIHISGTWNQDNIMRLIPLGETAGSWAFNYWVASDAPDGQVVDFHFFGFNRTTSTP